MYHPEKEVASQAAICLGHVARIHQKLALEPVIKALEALLHDKSISKSIESALKEIRAHITNFDIPDNSCFLTTCEEYENERRALGTYKRWSWQKNNFPLQLQ